MYVSNCLYFGRQPTGSILCLDYKEAFVATSSIQVRTCRELLDLIPPTKSQKFTEVSETRTSVIFKMLKHRSSFEEKTGLIS